MKVEILESPILPKSCIQLAEINGLRNLFSSRVWYTNFINTIVSPGDTILWIVCKSFSDEPILVLPLWQERVQGRKIRKLKSLSNYYTSLYEPLLNDIDKNLLEQAVELSVKAICQLDWDIIELYPFNPDSQAYLPIIQAFQRHSKHVNPYFMYGNWFLLTSGNSFKDYYIARPGQLKNTIKRRSNKLKHNLVEYQICSKPEEVDSAVKLFQQTYKSSWKQDEPYPNFIHGLTKTCAESGWLRLGLMFIDHHVVAAQIWLTLNRTAYIYKLCQDKSFDAYSPGSLLTAHLMQYAFDVDKVAKIDFLSGDDLFKKDWMSERAERWGLQISNPKTLLGFLLASKNICGMWLKAIVFRFKRKFR